MSARRISIGVILVVFAVAAGWWFGFLGNDVALAGLQQLRDEMSNEKLSESESDALRAQFRQRLESLDDSQRQAFFEASRGDWVQQSEQRMDEFFTLAPDARRQQLDAMIDRMRERGQTADTRPGGGDRGNRGGRNFSDGQRDEWAKRRLDRTTPKMRAQRDQFRRMMSERLQARGIDSSSLRGRWRGRA